jgi:hypothetical protein
MLSVFTVSAALIQLFLAIRLIIGSILTGPSTEN